MQLCLTLFLFIISECAHLFLREEFSPKTGLAIQHSLNDLGRSTDGFWSKTSSFELTWTVLDLQRTPPRERCCYECNPELLAPFAPANKHDPRLSRFSHHFQYGLAPQWVALVPQLAHKPTHPQLLVSLPLAEVSKY